MKKLLLGCFMTLCLATVSFGQEDAIKDSLEVFFELDKAILKDESKTAIDSAFAKYKERLIKMRVTGHTCDLGSDNYNMGLSERRAESAFEYIKTLGEYKEKCELFFYGEKVQKYDERAPNRRVHVLFYLEDDDIDTLVKNNCAEVFVEKTTYKPNKNKKITFDLKYFDTGDAMKSSNLSILDSEGRKLYFNSVMYYNASFEGADLAPKKNVKIKLPLVNEHKEGYTLYTGQDQGGTIVWKNTSKPCVLSEGADCNTYDFDWMLNGYCACAKQRKCEDDCNPDPFEGEFAPDLKDANVRYSANKTVAKFAKGTYDDLSSVTVIDDTNFDEDLDVCDQFKYAITSDQWYPSRYNVKNPKKNIIIKGASQPNKSNTTRIYIPKADVSDMDEPVLLIGDRDDNDKYVVWGTKVVNPTTCIGEVNCDYVVYDVPSTGVYKLCEWEEKDPEPAADKYVLKTRVLKDSKVLVGDKSTNEVYLASNATRRGRKRKKEYNLRDFDNAGDIVVYVQNTTKRKPMYQEASLTELKFKSRKNMYIMRKRDFIKVDSFDEAQFQSCGN